MKPAPSGNHLHLFQSLFRGREDVFAVRWEKGKRNGYMPAYSYAPYLYRIHKMKGGTFKNYKDKTYSTLTSLANQPKNFSRIIHNYSDERKGFILWRDMLEEKLF